MANQPHNGKIKSYQEKLQAPKKLWR